MGVWQMLTSSGGRSMLTVADRGRGVKLVKNLADVICERSLTYSESLTKFGQCPSMDTLPAVRAALIELYVLKRIILYNCDLLLFNACLLEPLICLIKKLVHWGN